MKMSDRDKRIAELDEAWEAKLPCRNCAIKTVCKYCNAVKRTDYPPEVFDVTITCKIAHRYMRADLNAQSEVQ